jgi:hypothetical protein
MKTGLDEYTRNARLKPAFLVVLPIALTIAVLGFKQSATEGTLLGLLSSLGFTFLLSQIVRDIGSAKQPWLFQEWGGKPTTIMLRHGDKRLNPLTRARYHQKLNALIPEMQLPSAAQEKESPEHSDAKYESCVDLLLSRTRDKERFQLLFQENINYGFRRNLWAMRPTGIIICIFTLAALAVLTRTELKTGAVPWPTNLMAISIIAVLLTWWVIRITPQWVRLAADSYATRLLSTIDELQG